MDPLLLTKDLRSAFTPRSIDGALLARRAGPEMSRFRRITPLSATFLTIRGGDLQELSRRIHIEWPNHRFFSSPPWSSGYKYRQLGAPLCRRGIRYRLPPSPGFNIPHWRRRRASCYNNYRPCATDRTDKRFRRTAHIAGHGIFPSLRTYRGQSSFSSALPSAI